MTRGSLLWADLQSTAQTLLHHSILAGRPRVWESDSGRVKLVEEDNKNYQAPTGRRSILFSDTTSSDPSPPLRQSLPYTFIGWTCIFLAILPLSGCTHRQNTLRTGGSLVNLQTKQVLDNLALLF
jgi:hypothetical protein